MPQAKSPISSIVVKNPDILGGIPTISGTRIPTSLLTYLINSGYTDDLINQEYPSLTKKKILSFKKHINSQARATQAR